MELVHEKYKKVKETDKPFAFEYWWRVVKDEPKWLNRDVAADIMNKRNKVSSSGAYTSSNRNTDEAADAEHRRPQEQKAAKKWHMLQENMLKTLLFRLKLTKRRRRWKKIKQFNELLMIDTSSYSESQKTHHEKMLDFLSNEIYGVEKYLMYWQCTHLIIVMCQSNWYIVPI